MGFSALKFYQISGHMTIIVRATTPKLAAKIAFDVAEELRLKDVTSIMVNEMELPEAAGYVYPKEPTKTFTR